MTTISQIVAPPYHVQSTAANLQSGFPYFFHHESVSILWTKRWRTLCQHGVYPFTDGQVEDFDPIFDGLISLSNNATEILYRPDDYARPFLPVAEDLVIKASEAEEQGNTSEARDLYLRAAAVYRIARFPINRSQTPF